MFARAVYKKYFGFSRTVEQLISNGKLSADPVQNFAINYFKNLTVALETREKNTRLEDLAIYWSILRKAKPAAIKGAYIYGSVGSGKTMLMDLFYESLDIKRKSRVHFNEFMLEFHSNLKAFRINNDEGPMIELVKVYRERMDLLCLDEFQVTDIADAMILRSLLSSFIESGMTIVATSNRHPDELYLNGIQRASFIPCIELIKSSLEVINLSSENDYRSLVSSGQLENEKSSRFLTPVNEATYKLMNDKFLRISQNPEEFVLEVFGRDLVVKRGCLGGAAMFTFQDLFVEPKSAADYIKICTNFKAVFVTDFPEFTTDMRSVLRRFITFIDQVYEKRVELHLQSEVDILENLEKLQGQLTKEYDETFALNRTMSRLKEIKGRGRI